MRGRHGPTSDGHEMRSVRLAARCGYGRRVARRVGKCAKKGLDLQLERPPIHPVQHHDQIINRAGPHHLATLRIAHAKFCVAVVEYFRPHARAARRVLEKVRQRRLGLRGNLGLLVRSQALARPNTHVSHVGFVLFVATVRK